MPTVLKLIHIFILKLELVFISSSISSVISKTRAIVYSSRLKGRQTGHGGNFVDNFRPLFFYHHSSQTLEVPNPSLSLLYHLFTSLLPYFFFLKNTKFNPRTKIFLYLTLTIILGNLRCYNNKNV